MPLRDKVKAWKGSLDLENEIQLEMKYQKAINAKFREYFEAAEPKPEPHPVLKRLFDIHDAFDAEKAKKLTDTKPFEALDDRLLAWSRKHGTMTTSAAEIMRNYPKEFGENNMLKARKKADEKRKREKEEAKRDAAKKDEKAKKEAGKKEKASSSSKGKGKGKVSS